MIILIKHTVDGNETLTELIRSLKCSVLYVSCSLFLCINVNYNYMPFRAVYNGLQINEYETTILDKKCKSKHQQCLSSPSGSSDSAWRWLRFIQQPEEVGHFSISAGADCSARQLPVSIAWEEKSHLHHSTKLLWISSPIFTSHSVVNC